MAAQQPDMSTATPVGFTPLDTTMAMGQQQQMTLEPHLLVSTLKLCVCVRLCLILTPLGKTLFDFER